MIHVVHPVLQIVLVIMIGAEESRGHVLLFKQRNEGRQFGIIIIAAGEWFRAQTNRTGLLTQNTFRLRR